MTELIGFYPKTNNNKKTRIQSDDATTKQKINNCEYVKNKNNMERQSAEIMEIEVCIQNSQFQSQSATFA